ncbi:MAG TPA: DUF3309 family protein [Bryobacteraceae bacterium]|jgi:hypothetical protein|nr:DUF3309 family protein [Bryobacteraceae bacterium]
MGWRVISLIALFIALIALPIWPFSSRWTIYPSGFFFLIGIVTFAVSQFGRRGSPIWRNRGQG